MSLDLILVRHALTENAKSPQGDFERRLLPEGRKQCELLGEYFREKNFRIETIMSSPAERTRTTANLIANQLALPPGALTYHDSIYTSGMQQVVALIRTQHNQEKTIMLVGHNPTISMVANFFATDITTGLHPCDAVLIQFNSGSWADVNAANTIHAEWIQNAILSK